MLTYQLHILIFSIPSPQMYKVTGSFASGFRRFLDVSKSNGSLRQAIKES